MLIKCERGLCKSSRVCELWWNGLRILRIAGGIFLVNILAELFTYLFKALLYPDS
jgi:hypothetical protein